MQTKYIAALVFSVFVVVFTLQNVNNVSVQLLAWEMKISIALLVIAIFFLGGVSAIIFSSANMFKKARKIKELETEIGLLKNEVFQKEKLLSEKVYEQKQIAVKTVNDEEVPE